MEATGNYQEAIDEFNAAIEINKKIPILHMELGRNYRKVQVYDKAIEQFTIANTLNPSDSLPDLYISRTYATIGDYAKAVQYAETAVQDRPDDASLHGNLGVMYYRNLLMARSHRSACFNHLWRDHSRRRKRSRAFPSPTIPLSQSIILHMVWRLHV